MYRNKNVIDSEKFKRFFFFGIEDKREVREGILLFSSKKVYERHRKDNWYEIPNKQFENEIIQEAIGPYRQFCRFVLLNDKPETIDEVICRTSMDRDEDTPDEFVLQPAIKTKNIAGGNNIRLISRDDEDLVDVNREDLEQQLEKEMQRLKAKGEIIETKAGVFFERGTEERLKGGLQYIHGKGLVGEEGWTKQMYEILGKLEEIERKDEEKYQEYLLLTKFARAVNRFDKPEAERLNKRIKEKKKEEAENQKEIEID